MTDVFISYSRKDYRYDDGKGEIIPGNPITRVKEALDKAGISYWIDEEISLGTEWGKIIPKKIRSALFFLFISSQHSNSHLYTMNEVHIANNNKKKIIPFKIDDTPYNDDILIHIASLQHNLPYELNPTQALDELVQSINKLKEEFVKEIRKKELSKRLQKVNTNIEHRTEERNILQSKMDNLNNEFNRLSFSITELEEEKKNIEDELGSEPLPKRMEKPEAFLLVEEYDEQQIYCIYKGSNSFGSVKRDVEGHQQIILSSDILKGTHFSITVKFSGQQKIYRLSVYEPNSIGLNAKDNIVGEETQISPNDILVMNNVKIKLIENLN